MRKAFLRAPLNFSYISSSFNPRRMHPVLKRIRPHNGIDYHAPRGTPVYAAGEGTVIRSDYSRANGHHVFIQHANNIQTKYLHFTRRAVKKGQHVSQGTTIGYVGSTGLSTGPHLDFRMRRGKTYINPLSVELPSADPVPAALLPDFYFASRVHFAALDYFPNGSTEGREDFFTLAYRTGPSAGLIPGAGGAQDQ